MSKWSRHFMLEGSKSELKVVTAFYVGGAARVS